ncbi:MAG: DJ-1/PfpI family protein [Chloroflexi bacterium]|nr:DJ-1/PfpI family protein [Chloroflexota bacterium]
MQPTRRFRFVRRAAPYLFIALAVLAAPILVGAGGLAVARSSFSRDAQPPAVDQPLPALPTPDPAKRTAVVLSSAYGVELTDFLPPYEILARSGAFDVFVVAPERRLLPIVNANMTPVGLDFLPHYSFAEYETAVGRAPDLLVIPYFPNYSPSRDAAIVEWAREHTAAHTTVLTICAGTETLVDTGLVTAGHTLTTNLGWFSRLEPRLPDVRWLRNVRYADDGAFITSTNLTSGVDATLQAVDRLVDRATAERVARELGYTATHYLDDPSFEPRQALGYAAVAATVAFQPTWQRLGVVLYDGMSELALAGLVDPYTASYTAKVTTLAPERTIVTSRHGLSFVPRHDFQTAPQLDRVVLPGGVAAASLRRLASEWAAGQRGVTIEEPHRPGDFPYDATLLELARLRGGDFAEGFAHVTLIPAAQLGLADPLGRLALLVRPLGLAALVLVALLWSRRRRSARLEPLPA